MSRHLRLIAFCAGLLASAGCSNERRLPTDPTPPGPTGPTAPSPPPPPSTPQNLAAFALFEAASLHAALTASPLYVAAEDGKVWTDGPCYGGSLQGSLDGGVSPTPGTFLPTGSHTYVVSFSNCLWLYWGNEGMELNGVASAAYDAADWSNLTAMVSAESVRGQASDGGRSRISDVTAHGSAVWTRVRSSTTTTTYSPAAGSRLVNNSTTNVATFGGGSYSMIRYPGFPSRLEWRFDNLKVAIKGTEYTLHGSLDETSGYSTFTWTGEIRIINNGTLAARIYADARNALTIEVLVPLVPL